MRRRMRTATIALLPVAASLVATLSLASPAAALTCATRVHSDFNGDGLADLAVGQPSRFSEEEARGAFRVLYGTASGVGTAGNQLFTPLMPGMPLPITEDGYELGYALASGYFNNDCYADLAVGAPVADRIVVLNGSASGLTLTGVKTFTDTDFTTGSAQRFLGSALAAADFDGDTLDDLAIGASQAGSGGAVGVLYGANGGLSTARKRWITQSTSGIPGAGEAGDGFGFSLAAGDLTGDGRGDLVVGVPLEDIGSTEDAGAIVVIPGSSTGLATGRSQGWSQSTANVPGASEPNDRFGFTLAIADVNGDGKADLAAGAPIETIGTTFAAGAVTVLRGATAGLTATGAKGWSQATAGVPGSAEEFDQFGASITLGDYNGDGFADLAAGSPRETVGAASESGLVTVIFGSASMLTSAGARSVTQSSLGVSGGDGDTELFGWAVTSLRSAGATASDLAVGAPNETIPFDGSDDGLLDGAGTITVARGGAGSAALTTATAIVDDQVVEGPAGNDQLGKVLG